MKDKDIEVEAIVEQLPDECKPVVIRNRASKAERIHRVQVVLNLLAEGLPRHRIVDEMFRAFGVSERQCDVYLSDAYSKLQQSFKDDLEANKAQAIEWYFIHRQRCIDAEEYSAATQCMAQIDKIRGLVTPKVDISGQINIVTIDKQDEQL